MSLPIPYPTTTKPLTPILEAEQFVGYHQPPPESFSHDSSYSSSGSTVAWKSASPPSSATNMANNAFAIPLAPPMPDFFFTDIPVSAPALFSTKLQSTPIRDLGPKESRPAPIVRSDIIVDMDGKIEYLESRFPEVVRSIDVGPSNWKDLYHYFDAVDLWVEGTAFCFYVLHRIAYKNKLAQSQIADYAKSWVASHENYILGLRPDIPLDIGFSSSDDQNYLKKLLPNELAFLRIMLETYRGELIRSRPPRPYLSGYGFNPATQTTWAVPIHPSSMPAQEMPPYAPRQYQDYDNSIKTQRPRLANPTPEKRFDPQRPRGWSTDTYQDGREYSKQNRANNGSTFRLRRSTTNSRGPTPSKQQQIDPVYVLDSQQTPSRYRQRSPPHRLVSDPSYSHNPGWGKTDKSLPLKPFNNGERPNSGFYSGNGLHITPRSSSGSYNRRGIVSEVKDFVDGYGVMAHQASNGSVTFYYKGTVHKLNHELSTPRTVFVSGVDARLFESHELKQMMSQCGSVDTISYVYAPSGQTFVVFDDETSVERAIKRWNGFFSYHNMLKVRVPSSRPRTGSLASQHSNYSSNRPFYQGSIDYEPRNGANSRRGSIRRYNSGSGEGYHTRQSSYQSLPRRAQVFASGEELRDQRSMQDQLRPLSRPSHTPLSAIENIPHHNGKQRNETTAVEDAFKRKGIEGMFAVAAGQKENLPMSPRKNLPQNGDRKNLGHTRNDSGKKPMQTAVSELRNETQNDACSAATKENGAPIDKSNVNSRKAKSKKQSNQKKKNKKHQHSAKPDTDGSFSGNSSFITDVSSSESMSIPHDIEDLTVHKSTITSFSVASARIQSVPSDLSTQKTKKKVHRNNANNNRASDRPSTNMGADGTVILTENKSVVSTGEASDTPHKQSKQIKPIVANNRSTRKADSKSRKSSSTMAPQDVASESSKHHEIEQSSQKPATPKSSQPIILSPEMNENEWPALGLPRSPPSNMEGLNAASVQLQTMPSSTESIMEVKKNTKVTPKVAVPRTYQARSKSYRFLPDHRPGRKDYPFVRRSREG